MPASRGPAASLRSNRHHRIEVDVLVPNRIESGPTSVSSGSLAVKLVHRK